MFLTEKEIRTEWFYNLPCVCETESTSLREHCQQMCIAQPPANLHQKTDKSSLWWLCSGLIASSPLCFFCLRNRANSGRKQRYFLLSLSGKAKMVVSSDGHSRPLLHTFEKTHLSTYIKKSTWINSLRLSSEDSMALKKLFAQHPSILDPQTYLKIRRPRWRLTSLVPEH